MKDALGHGSNGGHSAYLRPDGRSVMPSRPAGAPPWRQPSNLAHIADLRDRLAQAQGPGHAHALIQGIKNAMGYST